MEVRLLDAGCGDCVALRCQGDSGLYRNLIFDSGPTSRRSAFANLLEDVRHRGEHIDLIVITHQDDDHLGGLLALLKAQSPDVGLIELLVMNTDDPLDSKHGDSDDLLSARQRASLIRLARDAGVRVCARAVSGDFLELDGIRIDVVAPSERDRVPRPSSTHALDDRLSSESDWPLGLSALLARGLPSRDTSPSNRSSIVTVVQHGGVRVLLTGDAPADRFLPRLRAYGCPACFDLVKLPHHGSARSISAVWAEYVDCPSYVICADGRRHPDKATIAHASTWGDAITIFSPRQWWDPSLESEIAAELGGFPQLVQADVIELCGGKVTLP